MLHEVLGWIMLGLSALAAVLLFYTIITWPCGPRHRCPGKPQTWREAFGALSTLRRGRCWYNLKGLIGTPTAIMVCPECGTQVRTRKLLREGRRFRSGRVSSALGLAAIAIGTTLWIRGDSWTSALPNLPLVMLSQTTVGGHDSQVRMELDGRIGNGILQGYAAHLLATTVTSELRNDEIKWNAEKALDYLEQLWPHSKPILERELYSGDGQSRALAAQLLRRLSKTPSDALLRACINDLRDDGSVPGQYLRYGNANAAAVYLLKWQARARTHVLEAVHSNDPQQRLLAAALCGYAGYENAVDDAVPVLLAHLRDNDIPNDAKLAHAALCMFGPDITDMLHAHNETADEQTRYYLDRVFRHLAHARQVGWTNPNPNSGPGWTYDALSYELENVPLFSFPSEYEIHPTP